MRNFEQVGEVLDLVAPAGGVTAGLGYLIGALFVIAANSAAAGEQFIGRTRGVYTMPKKAADVAAQGAAVYWDDTAKTVTITASGNTKIGVAVRAAAGADPTVSVRLNGIA